VTRRGFTLIELLVVVAIVAILTAIALPNFLAAQTRAKVARIAADLRTLRTAMESYAVDNGAYPETDFGRPLDETGAGPLRLTTPVAFMTSIPPSPFNERRLGSAPGFEQHASRNLWPLLVRSAVSNSSQSTPDPARPDLDSNYIRDRLAYLYDGDPSIAQGRQYEGYWALKSVGPDGIDDRNILDDDVEFALLARVYDPTNGFSSRGDIITFSDTQGLAVPEH